MGGRSPPNPRSLLPSKAHPEHRSHRKELEKEHGFGWQEPLLLGMLGVGLAFNIEKQVRKHEERKDKEEAEDKEREERRRRRREKQIRAGTWDPSRDNSSMERRGDRGGSDRGVSRDPRGPPRGGDPRDYRASRHQSVDYRRDPRYDQRYYEPEPRYEPRYVDRYEEYDDRREPEREPVPRGRSRRDSW